MRNAAQLAKMYEHDDIARMIVEFGRGIGCYTEYFRGAHFAAEWAFVARAILTLKWRWPNYG